MSNLEYRAEMEGDDGRDIHREYRPMPGFGGFGVVDRDGREQQVNESDERVNLFHDVFRGDPTTPNNGFSFKEKINIFLKAFLILSILFLCGIILYYDGHFLITLNF